MDKTEIAYNSEKPWPTAVVTSSECYGCCGSGHILIEAYNVLKNIYEERGYRGRDIPQLILENNIFGLDIDDRAAQLSGFALLMMARQDDRRIFTRDVRLNIVSLQESLHLDIAKLWQQLNFHQQVQTGSMGDMFAENNALTQTDSAEYQLLMRTLKRFVNAKTLGSLIQVPQEEEAELKVFLDALYRLEQEGDFQQNTAAKAFIPFIQQAWILAQRYDAVVANPPYMGGNYMETELKNFVSSYYPQGKADLYSSFMVRLLLQLKDNRTLSLMPPFTWMNLSSFEELRKIILTNFSIQSLVQPEYHSFFESAYVPICAFSISNTPLSWNAKFFDLSDFYGEKNQAPNFQYAIKNDNKCHWKYNRITTDFLCTPGYIIAYSLPDSALSCFKTSKKLHDVCNLKQGLITGDNERYLRFWHEISYNSFSLNEKRKKQNGSHIKKVVHTVNGMVIMIMLLTGRMMVIPLKTFIMTKVNYAHALKTYNFIVKRV